MYRKNNVEPKILPCKTVEEFFSRIQQPMDWVYNQVNSPQCVRIFVPRRYGDTTSYRLFLDTMKGHRGQKT